MKIGIDASRANKPIKTGVEWYSYHIIQELKKIDSDNQYFLYTNTPLDMGLEKCPGNFKEVWLKWPLRYMWTLIRLSCEIKFGKTKPDLLFVPAHTLPLVNPSKSVVTIHDIGYERFPDLYKWPQRFYHKWSSRFVKKHATKILTVSEFSKKEIMEVYGVPEEKIAVVYNGYDKDVYGLRGREGAEEGGVTKLPTYADAPAGRQNITRLRMGYGGQAKSYENKTAVNGQYMMFVGRLEAKKNIERLLDAFVTFKAKNPEDKHKLVLVGKPRPEFQQKMMRLALENKDNDIIHFEYLKAAEVASLLHRADLFVFPSLYEGFGIPVLEAMACGCPVICANTTSLPEVAGEAAIMFDPERVDLIVKAMETVLFNPTVAVALKEKGLERVKAFSWNKAAREIKEIMEKI
ncbi:TPA: hypothetical protein DF272_05800 [Candidatus Falkowbacteria bacterium]|nr:hypothetical protein [Candidatus Falkowbacteria bacterium]